MKSFNGKVLFLDRSDINTDEIIPAKYLTEIEKAAMKPHLLEDLNLDGFDPARDLDGVSVIVTRDNFGCGSSREHAPWALECNHIHVVIAQGFARIFRQNMFNCGMLAIALPPEEIQALFDLSDNKDVEVRVDLDQELIYARSGEEEQRFSFTISEFDKTLVKAGGWVAYADSRY